MELIEPGLRHMSAEKGSGSRQEPWLGWPLSLAQACSLRRARLLSHRGAIAGGHGGAEHPAPPRNSEAPPGVASTACLRH
jgi:hypothetical protein